MNSWIDRSDRMDTSVIKKDGTAIDIEYFMATHVPFKDLEFVEFGETETYDAMSSTLHLTEEDIYDRYIVNKANKHQMLIVRGINGTGKSHLICWLYNRLTTDKDNYDDSREKVIFLRRLDNTIRGAIQQMLDEGLVQEPELQEKFKKFCEAAESQDENEFKTTIYNSYAMRVATDISGNVYKPVLCKNISSFLHDSRVQDYLMRADGPIDRCYRKINSGASRTGESDTIFVEEDFIFPRDVARSIKNNSAEEVKGFYLDELRDNDIAISKLVSYLNKFTSAVMQSCANITSENARDLFVNLRKSLYSQGKNLTLFIEDFTSLSIVESELLTALVAENGGKYNDLCRVTSVIGITDGYYDSFRDNFKNRVTKQIIVKEQAFSEPKFVLEMAARYLNAIYCEPEVLKKWYNDGAYQDELPCSGFKPEYEWDSVNVQGQELTLYPFNKKSVLDLYDRLKHKTPRYFLEYVIRYYFAKFADGMEYGDGWEFPKVPGFIRSVSMNAVYSSSVENSSLSENDQQRLKVLLATWGDGTSEAKEDKIGGVSVKFIAEIGLGDFKGISASGSATGESTSTTTNSGNSGRKETKDLPKKKNKKEVDYERRLEDIELWYESQKQLAYSSDFNKWIREFVVQGIPWQDEGIPGIFVIKRWNNHDFVFIENAVTANNEEKAVVVLKRCPESRIILTGLTHFNYYGNWDFADAAYYQFVMISWLKANTKLFKEKIFGKSIGDKSHPIITWGLAIEYIQRLIMGEMVDDSDNDVMLKQLIKEEPEFKKVEHLNTVWNDTITFLKNNYASVIQPIRVNMVSGSNSMMGVIGDSSTPSSVECYRTSELYESLQYLQEHNWNLIDELPEKNDGKIYSQIVNHLISLYDKVKLLVEEEKKVARSKIKELEKIIGAKPDEIELVKLINEIQGFYNTCMIAHVAFKTELKSKFDDEPIDYAKRVMRLYNLLLSAEMETDMIELLRLYASNPSGKLQEIVSDLKALETFANKVEKDHRKADGNVDQIDPLIVENALDKLTEISDAIEKLEVMS